MFILCITIYGQNENVKLIPEIKKIETIIFTENYFQFEQVFQ